MNPLRSVVAVVGGLILLRVMDAVLLSTLVRALADTPPTDDASYLAAQNEPVVLGSTLVAHTFSSVLVGYLIGRIARSQEVRHAIAAGVVLAAAYLAAVLADDPALPPMWARVTLLVVTPPALVAGATVRAQARAVQDEMGS
jgi:hypothetical protein